MDDTVKNKSGRVRRGQIDPNELRLEHHLKDHQLIELLQAPEARQRTMAAVLLGERRCAEAINPLCRILSEEQALYVRIAASEALGLIGEQAVIPLCALLGKIGDNQETKLPAKCCAKKSYPLVRDLAGRTLVKIGRAAVPELLNCLKFGDLFQAQQAIDTLGAIAAKTGDFFALTPLIEALVRFRNDDFTYWKLTRALGGFRHLDAVPPLIAILQNHSQPALRWESARSLGQIRLMTPEVINAVQLSIADHHPEVRKAAELALAMLNMDYCGEFCQ